MRFLINEIFGKQNSVEIGIPMRFYQIFFCSPMFALISIKHFFWSNIAVGNEHESINSAQ
jgi:hypothetical protein